MEGKEGGGGGGAPLSSLSTLERAQRARKKIMLFGTAKKALLSFPEHVPPRRPASLPLIGTRRCTGLSTCSCKACVSKRWKSLAMEPPRQSRVGERLSTSSSEEESSQYTTKQMTNKRKQPGCSFLCTRTLDEFACEKGGERLQIEEVRLPAGKEIEQSVVVGDLKVTLLLTGNDDVDSDEVGVPTLLTVSKRCAPEAKWNAYEIVCAMRLTPRHEAGRSPRDRAFGSLIAAQGELELDAVASLLQSAALACCTHPAALAEAVVQVAPTYLGAAFAELQLEAKMAGRTGR